MIIAILVISIACLVLGATAFTFDEDVGVATCVLLYPLALLAIFILSIVRLSL